MNLTEEQAIVKTVDTYLKAVKTGDVSLFEKAFYWDAVVISGREDDPKKAVTPIAVFANNVKKGHESGKPAEEIPLGMSVSYVGHVASVRLDFELRRSDQVLYGTDYFNLVKRNGEWKLSQKIFDIIHTK